MMYSYFAYGLGILSTLPLPELVAVENTEADVIIKLGKIRDFLPKVNPTGGYFYMSGRKAYFFWEELGAFRVSNGKEIIIDPLPTAEDRLIRLPLLGIVLSAVLQQRGFLGLHASAVSLNGKTVAFLGGKGMGKSTMAAALYAQGQSLVADDLVALDLESPGSPIVLSGFPQLKLMPEAAAFTLGDDSDILSRLASGIEKCGRSARTKFLQEPSPFKCIYVLSKGTVPQIELIRSQEALVQIIGTSYTARVFKEFLKGAEAASHFCQCAEIAKKIPVYRLKRPRSLDLLPEIVKLVEEHVETLDC